VLSLKERFDLLERDLTAKPPRITVHQGLPFAILRYEPNAEWDTRRRARLLAAKLNSYGKEVVTISFAELLWDSIDRCEGLDAIVRLERERGFASAEEQVTTYLSDDDWLPLPKLLAERMKNLDPQKHVAFLMRAASMAPAIYQMSKLLEEMHGRTLVPTILFYPGTVEGDSGLRFMGRQDRLASSSYRVKVYS
ncbi:MAG: BREX protein BrxB domain-containing protein, partial [Blastocatellia bacterium]